jgi:EAL domain-containing protein (putative c-di-GMP-specific phosphodiesterase class I)
MLASWLEEDPGSDALTMSVNLSASQLVDERFAEDLASVLEQTGLPASRLRLDVTEGAIMQDMDLASQAVTDLTHDVGVSFALDDFGTGPSSLSFLHQLPYDRLKIDRALIVKSTESEEQMKVLTAIVHMAQALGMEVIAEGVENEAQKGVLERMRCDYAQGYLFALPMDEEAALALLKSEPHW